MKEKWRKLSYKKEYFEFVVYVVIKKKQLVTNTLA